MNRIWQLILVLTAAGACAGRAAAVFSGFRKTSTGICLALFSICISQGSLILFDPFNYTVNSNLKDGSGGWTDSTSGGNSEVTIASGNLSVYGLAESTGNMAAFNGGGQTIQQAIASPQDVTTFYSFAFQVVSLGKLNNSSGDYFTGLSSSSGGTTFGSVVYLRVDPIDSAKFDIGIANRSSGNVGWSSADYSINSTIFVVGEYIVNSGSANDSSALWINPDSADFGAENAPSATLTASGGTDLSTVAAFFIRPDTTSSSAFGTVDFDELRVGTAWTDVTPIPELPAWGAIAGDGLLALCVWRVWQQRRCEKKLKS
jgi:hypothetical protein